MDHFQNPRNTGELPDADGIGQVGNPACGDVMRLFIKVRDNRLADIRCQVFGCAAAIACASAASEMVMGKSLEEAATLTRDAGRDISQRSAGTEDGLFQSRPGRYPRRDRRLPRPPGVDFHFNGLRQSLPPTESGVLRTCPGMVASGPADPPKAGTCDLTPRARGDTRPGLPLQRVSSHSVRSSRAPGAGTDTTLIT